MTTAEAVAKFRHGWQDYNGLTNAYARRQRRELHKLADAASLVDLDADRLRDYLERLVSDGLAPSTVGQRLIMVRPFFTWAFEHGLIDADRYLAIRSVRPPRNPNREQPRPYTAKDRDRFWADFDRKYPWVRDTYQTRQIHRGQNSELRGAMFFNRWLAGRSSWARCRPYCVRLQAEAIVALAMVGGLRRIEVWNLQLDDMDADNEYVIVQGARKGDGREKERAVPWLTQAMRDSVEKWLAVRRKIMDTDPPYARPHDRPWLYLYINGGGRPAYPMRFGPFDALMRSIGPWEWHRMRHTAATEMLRARYPVQTAQRILGHANVQTTMLYVKLLREDLVHEARVNQASYERRMTR